MYGPFQVKVMHRKPGTLSEWKWAINNDETRLLFQS